MTAGTPPLSFIDAAWWEVLGAELRAERLTGEAWTDRLALAWRLVRAPESLTPRQLERQEDMIERALGRRFYTTTPYLEWKNGLRAEPPARQGE